jgi:hypothetical protein
MGHRYLKRVNASSGCLHPVECYLILPLNAHTSLCENGNLSVDASVYAQPLLVLHYAPLLHALEVRGE